MSNEHDASPILTEPDKSNYRDSVDDLVIFLREFVIKRLKQKKPPSQVEILTLMEKNLGWFTEVLMQRTYLEDKTRTYKDNCRRMDNKGKADA